MDTKDREFNSVSNGLVNADKSKIETRQLLILSAIISSAAIVLNLLTILLLLMK